MASRGAWPMQAADAWRRLWGRPTGRTIPLSAARRIAQPTLSDRSGSRSRSVPCGGTANPVTLGGRAFDILVLLVEHAGQVVRHDDLITRVWDNVRVSPGTLRVHLTVLRKALDCRPDRTRYIANIPGKGYALSSCPLLASALTADPRRSGPVYDRRVQNEAEQLLATPNTSVSVISGIDSEQRVHDAARRPQTSHRKRVEDCARPSNFGANGRPGHGSQQIGTRGRDHAADLRRGDETRGCARGKRRFRRCRT